MSRDPAKAADVTPAACPPTRALGDSSFLGEFEVSGAAVVEPIKPGCQIANGRYRVRSEIARGGMGVVLHAHDTRLHRDVAIKVLLEKYAADERYQGYFTAEALMTSRLQHPCIVPIYDRGHCEDGRPFFAMKLVTGQTLESILSDASEGRLERSRLLNIFEQVCQTIAYVHSCGVLHLDLKPQNIMVGQFGEVHVMDWGLAREMTAPVDVRLRPLRDKEMTGNPDAGNSGRVFGTPAYMSPEQAGGFSVDRRADVFGLGGILCEILTGRPPYRGSDERRVFLHAAHGEVGEAMRGLDGCGREGALVELAKSCLSPKARDRPEDAQAVANRIAHYLGSALEQAESDLCRFFELSLDLMCLATLDGYFARVNANFTRVLGYPEEQLVSQPFIDFVHPDDVQETLQVMRDLLVGKLVVRFRNRYRHAEGHYVLLEWTARPIPEEGTIFAIARDVSDSPDP